MADQSIAPIHHPVVRRIIREIVESRKIYVLTIIEQESDTSGYGDSFPSIKTRCKSYENQQLMIEGLLDNFMEELGVVIDKFGGSIVIGQGERTVWGKYEFPSYLVICKNKDIYERHQKEELSWLYREYSNLTRVDPQMVELVVLDRDLMSKMGWRIGRSQAYRQYVGLVGVELDFDDVMSKEIKFGVMSGLKIKYWSSRGGYPRNHRIQFSINQTNVVQRSLGVE